MNKRHIQIVIVLFTIFAAGVCWGGELAKVTRSVVSITPVKRSQERITYSDGTKELRCYAPHNPHYYKDSQGNLQPISIGTNTISLKDLKLTYTRDRNIVTAVVTEDKENFLTLKPDEGGGEISFDIVKVIFDGTEEAISISRDDLASTATTEKYGKIYTQHTRQRTRQMVLVGRPISSFRIEYLIKLSGLVIEYREDLNEYWIYSDDKAHEFRFRIREPYLVDAATFEPLSVGEFPEYYRPKVIHRLTDNKDGTYTYIKESGEDFSKLALPNTYLIDADTYYASTNDGYVRHNGSPFSTIRGAATGTTVDSASTSSQLTPETTLFSGYYYITRGFFSFDTSGATNPSAVSFYGYGIQTAELYSYGKVRAMKGTQADTLTTADYDSFSGSSYGESGTWSKNAWHNIEFDSTGISDLNVSGVTKICIRDSVYDYGNTAPSGGSYPGTQNGIRFADYANITYDPYLSVTEGAAGTIVPIFTDYYFRMRGQ